MSDLQCENSFIPHGRSSREIVDVRDLNSRSEIEVEAGKIGSLSTDFWLDVFETKFSIKSSLNSQNR